MTDYSKPATPAEVCKRVEDGLAARAQQLRREAEVLLAQADSIEMVSRDVVFRQRGYYEQYQPVNGEGDSDE